MDELGAVGCMTGAAASSVKERKSMAALPPFTVAREVGRWTACPAGPPAETIATLNEAQRRDARPHMYLQIMWPPEEVLVAEGL